MELLWYISFTIVGGVLLGLGLRAWDEAWEKVKADRLQEIEESKESSTTKTE